MDLDVCLRPYNAMNQNIKFSYKVVKVALGSQVQIQIPANGKMPDSAMENETP